MGRPQAGPRRRRRDRGLGRGPRRHDARGEPVRRPALPRGREHTATSASVLDGLGPHLEDAAHERAHLALVHVRAASEAALVETVSFSDPQLPDTTFAKGEMRVAVRPEEEIATAGETCSPASDPEPRARRRERPDRWAGGVGAREGIPRAARGLAAETLPETVEPRGRWREQAA